MKPLAAIGIAVVVGWVLGLLALYVRLSLFDGALSQDW